MLSESALLLLELWDEMRGTHLIPRQEDVQLEKLEPLLDMILFSRWNNDGTDVIPAFVGGKLVHTFGFDTTGQSLLSFSHPKLIEESRAFLQAVRDQPCAAVSVLSLRGNSGLSTEIEFFYLPVEGRTSNGFILEVGHPIGSSLTRDKVEGARHATNYRQPTFFDIGAGTPETKDLLSGIGTASLRHILSGRPEDRLHSQSAF